MTTTPVSARGNARFAGETRRARPGSAIDDRVLDRLRAQHDRQRVRRRGLGGAALPDAGVGAGRRDRAQLRGHPPHVPAHRQGRVPAGPRVRDADQLGGHEIRRPEPPGDGVDVRGSHVDLRRARPGRTHASGRGPRVGRRRRGVPDRGRARLLLDDRGLPGDRGLPQDDRVDGGADTMVRRPAGPGAVHRSVCGPPCPDHAVPRSVRAGSHRARCSPWSGTRPTAWTRRPAWRSTSGGKSSASAATTTRPPRRTTRQRRTAMSRNRAWLCCGSPSGRTSAAVGAVRRLLGEYADPVHRSQVLPAAVEVLLAGSDPAAAGAAADELDSIAAAFDTPPLTARAACARGAVTLASGDPAAALSSLRRGWQLWQQLGARYDAARARTLIGLAFRALGDDDSAIVRARRGPAHVSATSTPRPTCARVDRLLTPRLPDGLTEREVDVLRLVAQGQTNPQIAAHAVPQREDGGAPPEQHLRQDPGLVADRGCRLRLRAPARGRRPLSSSWAARGSAWRRSSGSSRATPARSGRRGSRPAARPCRTPG